jgi:hypothetical protein
MMTPQRKLVFDLGKAKVEVGVRKTSLVSFVLLPLFAPLASCGCFCFKQKMDVPGCQPFGVCAFFLC